MAAKWKYDAFISYSHFKDQGLARSLQRTIERWGAAIPGRRPLRVFRDESNLSANPDLWETLKEKLSQSGYFILLASPESARSPWVKKEVAHFVESRKEAVQRIGVVLTAGTLPWITQDDAQPEEDAIAPETLALFQQEPLVVDLRSFREAKPGPEFSGRVATLVAAILGKDKDEVFGEHLTAQRSFIASLVAGIVVLGLAIVLAVAQFLRANEEAAVARKQTSVAERETARAKEKTVEAQQEKQRADTKAVEAQQQAKRADDQAARATQEAHRADTRAREATSRRLADQADQLAEARADTALLLMAQAQHMADNTAIRSSWWKLLGQPDLPHAFLPLKAKSVRFDPDGSLVVGLPRGSLTLREHDGVWRSGGHLPPNARIDAAGDPGETWQWSGSCDEESSICSCSKKKPEFVAHGDVDEVCVASRLKVPGWCSDQPFEVPGVNLAIVRHGSIVHVAAALVSAFGVVTWKGTGDFACLALPSGPGGERPVPIAGDPGFFAGHPYIDHIVALQPQATGLAQSNDGQRLAVMRSGEGIEVWAGERAPSTSGRWGIAQLKLPTSALSVASSWVDGKVAIATAAPNDKEQGSLVVWHGLTASRLPPPGGAWVHSVWNDRRRLGGALALSHDGALLVAGVDVNLPVWPIADLERPPLKHYIGRHAATSADISSDGKHLVAALQPLDGTLSTAAVFSVGKEQEIWRFGKGERAALFLPTDGDTIVTAGDAGVRLWSLSRRKLIRLLSNEPALALAVDRGRGRLAVSLKDGDIALWEAMNGRSPIRSGRRAGKGIVLSFIPGSDTLLWVSEKGLEVWDWFEDTWLEISDTPHRDAVVLRDGSVLGLTEKGQVLVYDLEPARWLDQTCRLVGRNLTRPEWNKHIGAAFPYECVCSAYGPGEGWPEATCRSRDGSQTVFREAERTSVAPRADSRR